MKKYFIWLVYQEYIQLILTWSSPPLKLVLYGYWIPDPWTNSQSDKTLLQFIFKTLVREGPLPTHPGIFNWFSPEVLPLPSKFGAVWAINPDPWTDSQSLVRAGDWGGLPIPTQVFLIDSHLKFSLCSLKLVLYGHLIPIPEPIPNPSLKRGTEGAYPSPPRYISLILTWSSPSALWNWCCMGIKSRSLNRFLVWFPIDGGNSGCAFELEVAVCKMRVLHLFEKRKKGG